MSGEGTALRIGFVGANTPHAPLYARMINDGAVGGPKAQVVAVYDTDPSVAEAFVVDFPATRRLSAVEDFIGQVDGVMIIERDQRLHRSQAEPLLEAGIPVYINKPLADDMEDTTAILETVARTKTPMFAGSPYRFDEQVMAIQEGLPTWGPPRAAVAVGYREWMYYGVHPVEIVVAALGLTARWVRSVDPRPERDHVLIGYDDGLIATVVVVRDAVQPMELHVWGEHELRRFEATEDGEMRAYVNLLSAFLRMTATGEVPFDPESTREVMRILCAARESAATGEVIELSEPSR